MKQAHRLGKVVVFLLRIDEFIGVHNLLIVFPFPSTRGIRISCKGGSPFIIIDPFPIIMEKPLIGFEGIGPDRGKNYLICRRIAESS
jgi:hypothetical protein